MTRKTTTPEGGGQPPKQRAGPQWPWGWVIDSEHFIDLMKRVFDKHQGQVWMFNSDLAIHRDPSHFEALYDGYIRGNPKVESVRFVLSTRRLKQFANEAVYKWRFKDLPNADVAKFCVRTLEEVQETHSRSAVFAEFLRTFSPFDEDGNENVLVFYTVSNNILNGDTVTIFRPTVYPFVAVDTHGDRRRRALAGQSANWKVVAQLCADALQNIFTEDDKFSRLGVRRHADGQIREFTFDPPIPALAAPPVAGVSPALGLGIPVSPPTRAPAPEPELPDLVAFLRGCDRLDLAQYAIVGSYVRYEDGVRNGLRHLLDEIGVVFGSPGRWKRKNNFLLLAAPGTGKTGFVNEMGAHLKGPFASRHGLKVHYVYRKLSDLDEAQLRAFTGEVEALLHDPANRVLAFLDEIDKRPGESWPLTTMLGPLEWNAEQGKPVVWLFAGSRVSGKDAFENYLGQQDSGLDFLRRVWRSPTEISPLTVFDRALIACSHISSGCPHISFIERKAILFLAGSSGDAGEVIARTATTLRNLNAEPTRTCAYLTHCIEFGSTAVDEFQSRFRSELKTLGSGVLKILPAPVDK